MTRHDDLVTVCQARLLRFHGHLVVGNGQNPDRPLLRHIPLHDKHFRATAHGVDDRAQRHDQTLDIGIIQHDFGLHAGPYHRGSGVHCDLENDRKQARFPIADGGKLRHQTRPFEVAQLGNPDRDLGAVGQFSDQRGRQQDLDLDPVQAADRHDRLAG